MFAVDLAYDGSRGSDGFITYIYGLSRLNVCQTMVVDDLEDISLIKSRNCLCRLVVIDKNQLLVACLQQVIAGQGADYLIVLIEYGVRPETALKNDLLNVIDIVA